MTSTYDLIRAIDLLVASLEDSGGEATDATEEALLALVQAADDKAAALVAVDRRLAQAIEADRELEQRLAGRRKARAKAKERVRGLLYELLLAREEIGGEAKVATPLGTAYLSTSTRVEGPRDDADWPAQYRREVLTVEADRKAALADLRGGAEVAGVRLVTSRSVGVR